MQQLGSEEVKDVEFGCQEPVAVPPVEVQPGIPHALKIPPLSDNIRGPNVSKSAFWMGMPSAHVGAATRASKVKKTQPRTILVRNIGIPIFEAPRPLIRNSANLV